MALYTISDLHLSLGCDKPMNVFGGRWQDHTEKIKKRWSALVTDGDTVIMPGDFSWALTLTETREDFLFLASLPGKKILSKGNHDYWWSSVTKMNDFLADNGVGNVTFLHNNAFLIENTVICGSRGWFIEESMQADAFATDYSKLVNRECERLSKSLEDGEKLKNGKNLPTVVFLHFPPVYRDFVCEPILKILSENNVARVYYGHIHGDYYVPSTVEKDGVKMSLVSADYVNFTPERIFL